MNISVKDVYVRHVAALTSENRSGANPFFLSVNISVKDVYVRHVAALTSENRSGANPFFLSVK